MLACYKKPRTNINDTNPKVAERLPTAAQQNIICWYTAELTDFTSATKVLQSKNATIE